MVGAGQDVRDVPEAALTQDRDEHLHGWRVAAVRVGAGPRVQAAAWGKKKGHRHWRSRVHPHWRSRARLLRMWTAPHRTTWIDHLRTRSIDLLRLMWTSLRRWMWMRLRHWRWRALRPEWWTCHHLRRCCGRGARCFGSCVPRFRVDVPAWTVGGADRAVLSRASVRGGPRPVSGTNGSWGRGGGSGVRGCGRVGGGGRLRRRGRGCGGW